MRCRSRYVRQLDAFRADISDPKILILDFDELKSDPMATLGRCVDFLGIDPFRFTPISPKNVRKSANRADEFRLSDGAARCAR